MPKKGTKPKVKSQPIAPVGLKVKLVDVHARAQDGNRAGGKQPAGANQAHQPGQRVKALKKNDKIEPLLVETKKVRPSLSRDQLRSIEEISRRERLRSPPPPQMARPGHTPGQTGRKAAAEKKAPKAQKSRVKTRVEDDEVGTQFSQTSAGSFLRVGDGEKTNEFSSQPPSKEGAGQVDNVDDQVHEGDESEDIDLDESDDENRDRARKKERTNESELEKLKNELETMDDQVFISYELFKRFVSPFLEEEDALDNLDAIVANMPPKLTTWIAYGVGELGDMEHTHEHVKKIVRAIRAQHGDPREDPHRHDNDDDDNDDHSWSNVGASGRHKAQVRPRHNATEPRDATEPRGRSKAPKLIDPFTSEDEFDTMLRKSKNIDELFTMYTSIHDGIVNDVMVTDEVNIKRRCELLKAARDRRLADLAALAKRQRDEDLDSSEIKRLKARDEAHVENFRKLKSETDERSEKQRVAISSLKVRLTTAQQKNTGATSKTHPSIERRAAEREADRKGTRTPEQESGADAPRTHGQDPSDKEEPRRSGVRRHHGPEQQVRRKK